MQMTYFKINSFLRRVMVGTFKQLQHEDLAFKTAMLSRVKEADLAALSESERETHIVNIYK